MGLAGGRLPVRRRSASAIACASVCCAARGSDSRRWTSLVGSPAVPLSAFGAVQLETAGAGNAKEFLTLVKSAGKRPGSGSSANGFGNVVRAAEGDGREEGTDDDGRSEVSILSASVMVINPSRLVARLDRG